MLPENSGLHINTIHHLLADYIEQVQVVPDPARPRCRNFYEHCEAQWQEDWDCTVTSNCPLCGHCISPYSTETLP
jgi:hypothetical protein